MLSRYKWLNAATAKIHFPPDRKQVQQELSDHIEDLRAHYTTMGLTVEEAETAAIEAMGDPEAIAADLGQIHRPWLGYLWWLSRGLIVLSIAACVILSAFQIYTNPTQDPLYRLPGWEYYDYLTWEFMPVAWELTPPGEYTAQTDLIPTGSVTTGGYTIRADSAAMRQPEPSVWNLYVSFHIDTGWRNEELYWGPNIIGEIRDSAGTVYSEDWSADHFYYLDTSSAALFLGQKAALELNNVPQDTEWIEIDMGYGTLQRTMHIDLQEEAS